jgi:hypothetical protein
MLNVLSTSWIFVVLERKYEPGAWWALYIHFYHFPVCTFFGFSKLLSPLLRSIRSIKHRLITKIITRMDRKL